MLIFPRPLRGSRVRLEALRNAQDQGALVAADRLGRDVVHLAVPWYWSDQHDLGLQVAALADKSTDTVRRDLGPDGFLLLHLASDGRLVAAGGIGVSNAVARDILVAAMLIARRAYPPPAALAASDTKLKGLLTAPAPRAA